jgi:hypothetical protein
VTVNVKEEYLKAMERLGLKPDSITLVKGVKGVISREKTAEALEKGILRAQQDIFVNVAGGVHIEEPAVDLGIVSSVASSFLDKPGRTFGSQPDLLSIIFNSPEPKTSNYIHSNWV